MDISGMLNDAEWPVNEWENVTELRNEEEKDEERDGPSEIAQRYIERLTSESGLHLLKPRKIERAYAQHGERGLFGLFVSKKLKRAWRIWTNEVLKGKGEALLTFDELDAYIGLEMAMSLVPITDIKELWSDKPFQGHPDFKATMSRTRFQTIRGSIQIHPPLDATRVDSTASSSDVDPNDVLRSANVMNGEVGTDVIDVQGDGNMASSSPAILSDATGQSDTQNSGVPLVATATEEERSVPNEIFNHDASYARASQDAERNIRQDPLWHSRHLLEHFQRKFAQTAVPFGVSSLDENGLRTKARTLAKSFMPLKPDKFAIRFYAVVGWHSLYVHSIWDNGSGNTLPTTPVQRYTRLFPRLRTPIGITLRRSDCNIKPNAAAALWMAMIAHQTQLYPSPSKRRLLVCDNFYTRHILANAVLALTDGEVRMLGTVRQGWIDALNKSAVADAVERVQNSERGSWELIAAINSVEDSKERRAAHKRSQAKLPVHLRSTYAPAFSFASCAGFVVFKDKKAVVFYTNDLAQTPSARILDGTNPEAIACCHGLYPMRRWTGTESIHRTVFAVPTVVAAYNLAMNGVDRIDQLRATNPTRRKEVRLSMSLLTWALDMSVINAYALMRRINPNGDNAAKTLREFKRRVCEALVSTQRTTRELKAANSKRPRVDPAATTVHAGIPQHVLTPNSREHSSGKLACYLCSLQGLQSKSRYGCPQCQRGYHVECFSVVHFQDAFTTSSPSVTKALEAIRSAENGRAPFKTRRRSSKSITQLSDLVLPTEKS